MGGTTLWYINSKTGLLNARTHVTKIDGVFAFDNQNKMDFKGISESFRYYLDTNYIASNKSIKLFLDEISLICIKKIKYCNILQCK